MTQLELPKELSENFSSVKDKLLLSLKQTPATQLQRYGGSKVELYPETEGRSGLYLMANDEFVDKTLMMGYPSPATAEMWVFHYINDFSQIFRDAYNRAEEEHRRRVEDLGYHSPALTNEEYQIMMQDPRLEEIPFPDHWDIIRQLPQEEIETALQEGIKILEAALVKTPYTELGFGAFTPDQITRINDPQK